MDEQADQQTGRRLPWWMQPRVQRITGIVCIVEGAFFLLTKIGLQMGGYDQELLSWVTPVLFVLLGALNVGGFGQGRRTFR